MKDKLLYYPILPDPKKRGSERSDDVREWVNRFLLPSGLFTLDEDEANAYFVATGDGGFIKTCREKHEKAKIFVGANRGTVGFLLNPIDQINQIPEQRSDLEEVKVRLMQGTFITNEGEEITYLAFNDIFCGSRMDDSITFEIYGSKKYFQNRRVYGNGIVVSTPQGSTGFAMKLRGNVAVLPLDTNNWFISGMGTGLYPCDVVSPQKIKIKVFSRDMVHGWADGKRQVVENIKEIIIEPTDYVLTLGYLKDHDYTAKRTALAQKQEIGEILPMIEI